MPAENNIRVLIVDDITETRESIKRMLQFDHTIEVVGTARTGREAIDQVQKLKPHVILMDINMPDMDGIDATKVIKSKFPHVQVIILSVQSDQDYMRKAMQARAYDFLPKPPMIDELTSTIRRAGKVALEESSKIIQNGDDKPSTSGSSGKVIVVFSPKGGVGCTTVATNLSLAIRARGASAVLVDGSMQFGDVAVFFSEQARNSVADLTPRVDGLDKEVIEEVMIKHSSELRILAAPSSLEQAEGISGEQFSRLLLFLKKVYSYVVVDTASYLTDATLGALECADQIILITTQDIPAIKSAHTFLGIIDSLPVPIPRDRVAFVMNKYDKRIGITPEKVGENLRQPMVMAIPLDDRGIVGESIKKGTPLMLDNRAHPVCKSIVALFNSLVERMEKLEVESQVAK